MTIKPQSNLLATRRVDVYRPASWRRLDLMVQSQRSGWGLESA